MLANNEQPRDIKEAIKQSQGGLVTYTAKDLLDKAIKKDVLTDNKFIVKQPVPLPRKYNGKG
jgi:hypothetical protein